MALIYCPECGKQVSDSAASCPNCGFGIASMRETNAVGTPLTTIQQTSKKLKVHYLISVSLIIIGLMWIFISASAEGSGQQQNWMVPVSMTFVGLFWSIVTKIRAWWHHK